MPPLIHHPNWIRSRVRGTYIEHWKNVNPREVLSTLSNAPLEKRGSGMVTIHELGTRRVSVRTVPSHVTKNYLPLFETVNRKAALIGLPLAVVRTRKEWKVVMHWKPHRHSMRDYVRDAPLPNVRKALWSAATQLGKLHGAGFIHGHAQVIGNLVVNDRMNTQLVDPKFLYESTARAEQYAEYRIFIQDIHHPLQRRMNPGQFLKLRRLLRHQYNRAFERARKPASSE